MSLAESTGSMACPVCGCNEPHSHFEHELKERPYIDGAISAFESAFKRGSLLWKSTYGKCDTWRGEPFRRNIFSLEFECEEVQIAWMAFKEGWILARRDYLRG
jgi:hypothetical protein